jgi:pyrroloquinoline-quinone synthase
MTKCPVCRTTLPLGDYDSLAEHFVAWARSSDPPHVRFLNSMVSKKRMDAEPLARRLEDLFRLKDDSLTGWIRAQFVRRFFGPRPHPFVAALQHPDRPTLLGYVVEHQHFLRQWVRSCAFILARTDRMDVSVYELDNLSTEFGETGRTPPAHYELLLQMGESYGLPRTETLATVPLPTTARVLAEWQEICSREPWVEAMAAMHSLELIAHRDLKADGATVGYFDPVILTDGSITDAATAFLREGYEADVDHAERALALVEKYARELGLVEGVQATFLRSMDLFDDYLGARLERAEAYGPSA